MKKRPAVLLISVLVLAVLAVGCSQPTNDKTVSGDLPNNKAVSSEVPLSEKSTSSEKAEEATIYPTFGNTEWGMSTTEAFEVLGTAANDWKKVEVGDTPELEDLLYETYVITDFDIYGIKASSVFLKFSLASDLGLISAEIRYPAGDEIASTAIYNELVKLYGEPKGNVSGNGGSKAPKWASSAVTVKQWDEGKRLEKYLIAQNEIRKEAGIPENDLSRLAISKFDYYSLCTVASVYSDDEKVFPYSSVSFDGFYAALFDD